MDDQPYLSLYRRFRPGRFSELRGQPHVVMSLQSSVRENRVTHAYLFSGPRGTGKTSAARILAKALNCESPIDGEPCGKCSSCLEITRGTSLDVHELDAASNNGVDAMRDLINHAALGTPGRWKIYIVDEVHMLSNAAANALLKTLEEPPSHVIFVLATTDPQKVPATIRSRTQHFEFRLLGAETLSGLLHDINDAAGLALDETALNSALRRGRGSARDALSALDQVASSGTSEQGRPDIKEVIDALIDDDAPRSLAALAAMHEAGWGPQQLAVEVIEALRQIFLCAVAPELADLSALTVENADRFSLASVVRAMEVLGKTQVDMRDSPDPRITLEVALVKLTHAEMDDASSGLADRVAKLERMVANLSANGGGGGIPNPTPLRADSESDVRTRPSIGALRRQGLPKAEPETKAPSGSTSEVDQAAKRGDDAKGAGEVSHGGALPPMPGRDELVQAWGDHVLRELPARAKALFSSGRFVEVGESQATFAIRNEPHKERCEAVRKIVEDALGAHFLRPIPLVLVVEAEEIMVDDDVIEEGPADIATDGVSQENAEVMAQARVLEAFPGAEEMTP